METSNARAGRIERDFGYDATANPQGGHDAQLSTSVTDETPLLGTETGDSQYSSSTVVEDSEEQESGPGEADFAGLPWTKRPSVSQSIYDLEIIADMYLS